LAGWATARIRGSHVRRVFSDDVANGHFVLDHLVVPLSISDVRQILVRPCVASNLMALCYHTLDDVGPRGCRVDSTFAKVVPRDEEGSLEAIGGELVEDLGGIEVWA
jgi:hypothetical protein